MTNNATKELESQIFNVAKEDQPLTLRSLYYRMVSAGYIEKTELAYKRLGRIVVRMRREKKLPYSWIYDPSRFLRRKRAFPNIITAVKFGIEDYQRDHWLFQPYHVEVWAEKDALAGVLSETVAPYNVGVESTHGFASVTLLHDAVEIFKGVKKPVRLIYLGDYDPSGVCIEQTITREFEQARDLYDLDIQVRRIAVTREQIESLSLQTRPTKESDTRSRNFHGESVEVDAVPTPLLRKLVIAEIERYIDADLWNWSVEQARQEYTTMKRVLGLLPGPASTVEEELGGAA